MIVSETFHFYGICRKNKEPTSGLEPLTCSLRVIHHVLQGLAWGCKSRIFRALCLPCLAAWCTVLRSRWYQSGIKTLLLMHQGRYRTSGVSILSLFLEYEGSPHLWIATPTGCRAWAATPPRGWTRRWAWRPTPVRCFSSMMGRGATAKRRELAAPSPSPPHQFVIQ